MGVADRVRFGGHFSAALGRASTSPMSRLMRNISHHPVPGVTLQTQSNGRLRAEPWSIRKLAKAQREGLCAVPTDTSIGECVTALQCRSRWNFPAGVIRGDEFV